MNLIMKRLALSALIAVLTAACAFGAVQDFEKFTLDIPEGWKAEIIDDVVEIIVEIQNNDNSSSMTLIYGAVSNGEPLTLDEFIKDWPELYNNPSKIERTDDGYYTFTHTNDDGKKAAVYAREVYSGGRAMYYSADMTGKDIAEMKKIRDSFKLKDSPEEVAGIDRPVDSNSNTNLILASVRGNTGTVRALLKQGANADIKNKWGMTALMYAAEGNHSDTVRALLEAGAEINAQNNEGSTALIIAAIHGCEETVNILLKAGADATIKNNSGKKAVDYAKETLEGTKAIKLLKEAGK